MRKKSTALLLSITLAAAMLGGCGKDEEIPAEATVTIRPTMTTTPKPETTEPAAAPAPGELNERHGEIRTKFNDSLDLSACPLTPNDAADDLYIKIEAEDASLSGNAAIQHDDRFSGGAYVNGQSNSPNDTITFNIDLENTGFYSINFRCHSGDHGRTNYLYIDGSSAGDIICNSDGELVDAVIDNVYMAAGSHELSIVPYWGYTDFDFLEITKSSAVTDETYNVTAPLSNPSADENTKRLYKFLCDIYGKYSLTGQYADRGRISLEYSNIYDATGSHFAVLGLDLSAYSTSSIENGVKDQSIGLAYDWYENAGGIVQFCWHWTAPEEYVGTNDGDYWWNSFYKEHTTLDLDKIMNGEDDHAYELLMEDIDSVAKQLKRLRDAGVPVLFRPLHEASGGWFWWGDCSADSYKKLWNIMYDKLTNEHGLTNLIWVWNSQSEEWYPGDDTVDILAYDIYAPEHNYSSYSGTFAELANTAGESKLVALSENGVVMDPDLTFRDNARWLFWGTWSDPFTLRDKLYLNDEYTETDMLIKAYQSDRTLTLEELPDLKNYPLD